MNHLLGLRTAGLSHYLLLLAIIVAASPGELRAESSRFPYDAYIVQPQAAIYSGPSDDYYATSMLPRGSRVTVYKQAPGGWLAIQPPEGSFSWVPADKVEKLDRGDLGELVEHDVPAWVGSEVEKVLEHKWQVQLKHGEHVQLLGEKQIRRIGGQGESTWYRIAAPSGEFRWIRDRDVTRRRANDDGRSDEPAAGTDRDSLAAHRVRDEAIEPAAWYESNEPRSQTREPARRPIDRPADRVADRAAPRVASLAPREPDRIRELDSRPSLNESATSSAYRDELGRVEVEMALMVAKEPSYWDFTALRARLQTIIDQGTTPVERGRARLVLDRLDGFETLRKRQVQIDRGITDPQPSLLSSLFKSAGNSDATESSGEAPANQPTTAGELALNGPDNRDRADDEDSRPRMKMQFAGTGQLRPVYSQDPRAPRFALTDTDGKVRYLVVPAPGLNLRIHESKNVGIRGRQAGEYRARRDPSHPLPVLIAENVIDLDRHRTAKR